jgi:hypothetical protein
MFLAVQETGEQVVGSPSVIVFLGGEDVLERDLASRRTLEVELDTDASIV